MSTFDELMGIALDASKAHNDAAQAVIEACDHGDWDLAKHLQGKSSETFDRLLEAKDAMNKFLGITSGDENEQTSESI